MLERILPRTIDNAYRGHKLAIWLLVPIILIKMAIGVTSMFVGQLTAQGAHKIPLAAFPPEAAQLLVLVLARSGLSTLVITLFCVLVLIRYRAMIPAAYVLLLLEHTGRAILVLRESAITGASRATVVGLVLLFLTVVGFFASLYGGADGAKPNPVYPTQKAGA
ncbi:MAG: hypothetical protein ACLQBK_15950 [Candidatus Sulfotelmatobacter sp.]